MRTSTSRPVSRSIRGSSFTLLIVLILLLTPQARAAGASLTNSPAPRCEPFFATVERPSEVLTQEFDQPYRVLGTSQLYARVKLLLEQPITSVWRTYIDQRLAELNHRRRLPWLLVREIARGGNHSAAARFTPEKRARVATTFEQIQALRQAASESVRKGKTAGARESWNLADEAVASWAGSGEPITIERLNELNRRAYDPEQQAADQKLYDEIDRFSAQKRANMERIKADPDYDPRHYADSPPIPEPYGKIEPGRFRRNPVIAGLFKEYEYIDHRDVPRAMEELIAWVHTSEGKLHPIELAALAYRRLLSIHPYCNANGRVARALADWILLRHGYPPAILVHDEAKAAVFGRLLRNAMPSAGAVVANFVDGVARALDELPPAVPVN